jgi:site-specific DNA-cytosine methylase
MRVLAAFESSGTIRRAFMAMGHDAWSCDLLECDDGNLFHIQSDAVTVIKQGWDLVVACPPCTHLAVSGSRHFAAKRADGRQQSGIDLFMATVSVCEQHAKRWAIENPIGIMSNLYRKPDQIIQPWQFGHPETKATCIWLGGGLPMLQPTKNVKDYMLTLPVAVRNRIHHCPPRKDRWKIRSKTFDGIANAMAAQWGG